jgi:hypothetical protein
MTSKWMPRPAEFSIAEVEGVAGFSADTIRTWRKRGLLANAGRYEKLDVVAVAALMIRKALVGHGLSPAATAGYGERYAPIVVFHAILDTPGVCEVRGSAEAIVEFEREFGDAWDLAAALAGVDTTKVLNVLTGTDQQEPTAGACDDLPIDPDSLTGYYVNLAGLGRQLGAKAQKPLVHIQVEDPGPARPTASSARIITRRIPKRVGDAP